MQDSCWPASGVEPPAVVTVYVRDQVYDWTAPGRHIRGHTETECVGAVGERRAAAATSLLPAGGSVSPEVEETAVNSGDTAAAVGELAEETPTEWTERAGE